MWWRTNRYFSLAVVLTLPYTQNLTQTTSTNSHIAFPVHRAHTAHRVVIYTPSRAYTFPTYIFIYIRNSQRKCIRTTLAIYIHMLTACIYIYEDTLGVHEAATAYTRMFLLAEYRFPRPPIFDDERNSNPCYWPPSKLPPNKPHTAHTHRHFPQILFCFMLRVLRPCCSFSSSVTVVVVIVSFVHRQYASSHPSTDVYSP